MSFIDYRVLQGDTLEGIAAQVLGTAEAWRSLAFVNRLRAPFISDAPIDQYGGHASKVGTLATAMTAGISTFVMPLPVSATIFAKGMVFYVERPDASQAVGVTFDALTLSANIDETTGTMNFKSASQHAYPIGSNWFLFYAPSEISTRVLKTGDLLHIPSTTAGLVSATNNDEFVSLLGVDIKLDHDGSITFAAGDMQTVSGVSNLRQALSLRLNTPYGTFPHHSTYGNQLFDFVGQQNNGYFANLVRGLVVSAISEDPRVEQVDDVKVTTTNVTTTADAQVRLRNASGLVRADNLVIGF